MAAEKIKVKVEIEIEGVNALAEALVDALKDKLLVAFSDPTTKIGQLLTMFGITGH